MTLNHTSVSNHVDKICSLPPTGYGLEMVVQKYSGKNDSIQNVYGYYSRVFEDDVTVVGRITVSPSEETISKYGGSSDRFDILAVISREELLRKFPDSDENTWLDNRCRLVFNGNTYELKKVNYTGHLSNLCTFVVCFGNSFTGKKHHPE